MKCTNSSAGALLTQYALNLLNEEDRCRFEEHVMSCESCRQELLEFDPMLGAIGARREQVVNALHEQGISFESLKAELLSTKKRGMPRNVSRPLSGTMASLFRFRILVPAAALAVIALLILSFPNGSERVNPYLPILSFDKFAYQEMPSRAMSAAPSTDSLFSKAMAAYNANDYKSAEQLLLNATQESPNEWSIWFFLGVTYYLDKQAAPAIAALLQADSLNRYALEIETKWYLAQAYLLNNDPEKALPYFLWIQEKPGEYASRAEALATAIREEHAK